MGNDSSKVIRYMFELLPKVVIFRDGGFVFIPFVPLPFAILSLA